MICQWPKKIVEGQSVQHDDVGLTLMQRWNNVVATLDKCRCNVGLTLLQRWINVATTFFRTFYNALFLHRLLPVTVIRNCRLTTLPFPI